MPGYGAAPVQAVPQGYGMPAQAQDPGTSAQVRELEERIRRLEASQAPAPSPYSYAPMSGMGGMNGMSGTSGMDSMSGMQGMSGARPVWRPN